MRRACECRHIKRPDVDNKFFANSKIGESDILQPVNNVFEWHWWMRIIWQYFCLTVKKEINYALLLEIEIMIGQGIPLVIIVLVEKRRTRDSARWGERLKSVGNRTWWKWGQGAYLTKCGRQCGTQGPRESYFKNVHEVPLSLKCFDNFRTKKFNGQGLVSL